MSTMTDTTLMPVVEDLSGFILGGRADPSTAIAHAVEAERLGFRRVWMCERLNIKDAGVLLGAIAARTSRIDVGTAPLSVLARIPAVTASMGGTMNATFGPRCILGLGRGPAQWADIYNLDVASYRALVDYADIMRRYWRGEIIDYDGPAGTFRGLQSTDNYDGPPPQIWTIHLGGPLASKTAASPVFDGVIVGPMMTSESVARSIATTRQECERIGRDPDTLRICAPVSTAPPADMLDPSSAAMANPAYGTSAVVTRELLKAFLAMSIESVPVPMRAVVERNGWDVAIADEIVRHPMFTRNAGVSSDHLIRDRHGFKSAADLIPEEWVDQFSATGSVQDCVRTLQTFRDAGADEIAIYNSTPAQCSELIDAWRNRSEARTGASVSARTRS